MPGSARVSESAIERDRVSSRARYHANRDQQLKVRKAAREYDAETRPFVGWDGEGYDAFVCGPDGVITKQHRFMLFGASDGTRVRGCITGISLTTTKCLELILDVERDDPDVYHVSFSFEYDVNMILSDLPWRAFALLRDSNHCRWPDPVTGKRYRIEHVPHKWLRISCDGVSATIYDGFGFFHCSYIAALEKYSIGSESKRAAISAGKAKRGRFTYADIEMVKAYWMDEISLLPPLMDAIRTAAYGGGYRVSEWHGPGALAAYLLRDAGVNKWHSKIAKVPKEVRYAIRAAYAGGRFTEAQCGYYIGDIYTADLNSAYIYACSLLPRLDKGRWIRQAANTIDPGNLARFGLYRIELDYRRNGYENSARAFGLPEPPYPLFNRGADSILRWPRHTKGWYWTPEAKLVAGDSRARFLEAWIWDDDGSYPFRFVNNAYNRRVEMQNAGNPAEKAYKWALAAMYGAFARRVGWDRQLRKAPPSHELAWAGWITSWCRAAVYDPALFAYLDGKTKGLISIDTDGVTATVPFRPEALCNGVGKGLGQWKLEKWTGILQWQNGIYWLRDSEGKWKEPKSRGIPKGSIPFKAAFDALEKMDYSNRPFTHPELSVRRTRFVGYSQALRGQFDRWQQWITEPVNVMMGGKPTGKAWHFFPYCHACRSAEQGKKPPPESLNNLHTITLTSPTDINSAPHKLPWLEEQPDIPNDLIASELKYIVRDEDM